MMPDVENGLFSRFLYYAFEDNGAFKNPFVSHRNIDYIQFFKERGRRVYELYLELSRLLQPAVFSFSPEQASHFTGKFDTMLQRSKLLLGNDLEANIKRLGLVTFRLGMIFSALRLPDKGALPGFLICNDTDFSTALNIAATLEKHAEAVYKSLPNNGMKGSRMTFYEALPADFDRKTYLKTASDLGINKNSADRYIGQMKNRLLKHEYNLYSKME